MNTHYLNGLPQEWDAIAGVFAALGDGTRQTILLLFEPGETIELKTLVENRRGCWCRAGTDAPSPTP